MADLQSRDWPTMGMEGDHYTLQAWQAGGPVA